MKPRPGCAEREAIRRPDDGGGSPGALCRVPRDHVCPATPEL